MDAFADLLGEVDVPRFVPVRQKFDEAHVQDLPQDIREAVFEAGVLSRVDAGARIAIGVGSRGIANISLITRTVVDLVRSCGADPFVVPAMGSHGGATAAGQRAVLEHIGVNEKAVGAPIRATMDVVQIGNSAGGLPLYFDRHAAEADGIIPINRIKPHTSFRGPVESGLLKMLVLGFGKQLGADATHARGFDHMANNILDVSASLIERLPVSFGLGVIENAYGQTARVVAVPAERMQEDERRLIDDARALMPRIMFNPLDVLIVDQIGKDVSGVGMDPNVTGRYPSDLVKGDQRVTRIVALRLTDATGGNAAGVGLADVTTRALEGQIDRLKGYMNSLTSTTMSTVKLPMVLATDDLAIRAAIKTCNAENPRAPRMARIRSTKHLGEIWVSEALLDEALAHEAVEVLGPPQPLELDLDGKLR
jgi:hypothetical protein